MANLLAFPRCVLQRKVVAPRVANPAKAVRARPLKGRNGAHRPDANEPSFRVALDLHGQQKHLQQDDSCEQDQRFVARGNGYHVDSEIRNSKLENRHAKLARTVTQTAWDRMLCPCNGKSAIDAHLSHQLEITKHS